VEEDMGTENDLYKVEVIAPGDMVSRLAKDICFAGHKNCPAVSIVPHDSGNFRGPVGLAWRKEILREMLKYKKSKDGTISDWTMMEEVENDGAGGKSQFFALAGTEEVFRYLGWEIIAMTADDFARSGRLACVIDNELQVKQVTSENFHLIKAMFAGYGEALKQANLVNTTGEVAVMKHSITAFCDTGSRDTLIVTWGASCIGLASKKLLLNPNNIRPGMIVVGLKENGYRCNGGTFLTNIILREWGPDIKAIVDSPGAQAFAEKLAIPSKSYAKTIARLVGWETNGDVGEPLAKIAGIAHITGGGIWGKFGELLPRGVGAFLNDLPKPPDVLLEAQKMSQDFPELALSDHDAYSTFHGGCGMLLVVNDSQQAGIVIDEAGRDGIEAQIVGQTDNSNELKILSRFNQKAHLIKKLHQPQ
jgi:phosphoribosylformylglycinamidine cyclo-ligase